MRLLIILTLLLTLTGCGRETVYRRCDPTCVDVTKEEYDNAVKEQGVVYISYEVGGNLLQVKNKVFEDVQVHSN